MSKSIFISHSTTDDQIVNDISDILENNGYDVWVDHRNGIVPGDPSWDREIRGAIDQADIGVLVMSPRALASDICASECLLVRETKKPLFILRIEDCDALDVWLYIKMIQYANLVDRFEQGMNEFLSALAGNTNSHLPQPYIDIYIPPSATTDVIDNALTSLIDDEKAQHFFVMGTPHIGKTALLDWLENLIKEEDLPTIRVDFLDAPFGSSSEQQEWFIEQVWEQLLQLPNNDLQSIKARQNSVAELSEKQFILRKALAETTNQDPIAILIDNLPLGLEISFRIFFEGREISNKPILTLITQSRNEATLDKKGWDKWQIKVISPPLVRDIALKMGSMDFLADAQRLHKWTSGIPTLLQNLITTLIQEGVLNYQYNALILQKPLSLPRDWHEHISVDIIHALSYLPDINSDDYEDWQDNTLEWLIAGAWLSDDQATFEQNLLEIALAEDKVEPELLENFLEGLTKADNPIIQRVDETINLWRFVPAGMRLALIQHPDMTMLDSAYWGQIALKTLEDNFMPDVFVHADRLRTLAYEVADMYITQAQKGQGVTQEIHAMLNKVSYYTPHQNREALITMQKMRLEQTRPDDHTRRWHLLTTLAGYIEDYKSLSETLNIYQQAIEQALLARQKPKNSDLPPPQNYEIAKLYSSQSYVLYLQNPVEALRCLDKAREALGNRINNWDWLGEDFSKKILTCNSGEQSIIPLIINDMGLVLYSSKDYHRALVFYNQALSLYQAIGVTTGAEVTVLNNVGTAWRILKEYDKALSAYNQALPIAHQLNEMENEAVILNNIGNIWLTKKDYEKALSIYNQTLEIAQLLGNKKLEGTILINIGTIWRILKDYDKALSVYNQALALHKSIGDQYYMASTLTNIAQIFHSLGDKQKACDYLEQAILVVPPHHQNLENMKADLLSWGCRE